MEQKKFQKGLEGLKKKAGQLSTLCDVEICLVVYGKGSQKPTAVWPDGDQIWKAEKIGRRYLSLPPKRPSSQTSSGILKRGGQFEDQELYDRLGGFSKEGLRDLARVLEGKLEEAKRKMEAGCCLPSGRRPGQSKARKRAKVGESGRPMLTPATPGAVDSRCNGMINGGSDVNGCVLDDQKKVLQGEGCSLPESERVGGLVLEPVEVCHGNLCPVEASDSGARGMVSCMFPASCMESCNNVGNLASWRWPDNVTFMEMIMCDDNDSDTQGMDSLWLQD